MLRGVPWSKRMSIGGRCMHRGREGRCQGLCREMQYSVDLFARNGEFLHDFFHGQASFQILEHRGNRHPGILKHPCATDFAGDALHGRALRPIQIRHDLRSSSEHTPFTLPRRGPVKPFNLELTRGLVYSGQLLLDLAAAGMLRKRAYGVVQVHAMRAWEEESDFRAAIEADPEIRAVLSPEQIGEAF